MSEYSNNRVTKRSPSIFFVDQKMTGIVLILIRKILTVDMMSVIVEDKK